MYTHVLVHVNPQTTVKLTSKAAMATRQARGFPPKVDPCSPGRMVSMTSSSASTADTCIITHNTHFMLTVSMTSSSASTADTCIITHNTHFMLTVSMTSSSASTADTCIITHNTHFMLTVSMTSSSASTADT